MRKALRPWAFLAVAASLAIGLIATFPSTSEAAPTCSGGRGYVRLAEDGDGYGDQLVVCHPSTASSIGTYVDLGSITHTQAGLCHATYYKAADNWEDCVSSVNSWFPADDGTLLTYEFCAVLYRDPPPPEGPGAALWHTERYGSSGWTNFAGSNNDTLSSIRWGRIAVVSGLGWSCSFNR